MLSLCTVVTVVLWLVIGEAIIALPIFTTSSSNSVNSSGDTCKDSIATNDDKISGDSNGSTSGDWKRGSNSTSGGNGSSSSRRSSSSGSGTGTPRVDATTRTAGAGGQSSSSSSSSSYGAPETRYRYANTFAELLSAVTAEFVFNVAGDHVLFAAAADATEDRVSHTAVTVVAELLQKLHLTADVYAVLNSTACGVAADMWSRGKRSNPVARIMRLMANSLARHPRLRDDYLAVKQRVENQIFSLPRAHGRFAANATQTLYDISGEQQEYAEKLMGDARVKRLVASVTLFKASQFNESHVPTWVRDQAHLARATFVLAANPKFREDTQRLYEEMLTENLERYDATSSDDEFIFHTLKAKLAKNRSLNVELETILSRSKIADTDT